MRNLKNEINNLMNESEDKFIQDIILYETLVSPPGMFSCNGKIINKTELAAIEKRCKRLVTFVSFKAKEDETKL